MKIESTTFHELSLSRLYEILAFRTEVFVVEQQCAYQEVDDQDQAALHILGTEGNQLVAYARVVAPLGNSVMPSIGRVAVHKDFRGKGFGRKIFTEALQQARSKYPHQDIKVQAQTYLESFYASFGFTTISEPYPDEGIWHIDMILGNK